jgi:hypothetical protein
VQLTVQDTIIQRKDSDGTNIGGTISLPSAEAADVTCPDATINRDGVFYANAKRNGTLNVPSALFDIQVNVNGSAQPLITGVDPAVNNTLNITAY